MTYNDLFRVLHDIFGHAAAGSDIIAQGEFKAFAEHAKMFSASALPALFTETVAQAAWIEAGPHRKGIKTPPTRYPPQKATILPQTLLNRLGVTQHSTLSRQ